jgi:hypothetical protein
MVETVMKETLRALSKLQSEYYLGVVAKYGSLFHSK